MSELWGRGGDTDLDLALGNVFVGTGGASPLVYDSARGKYQSLCCPISMMRRALSTS